MRAVTWTQVAQYIILIIAYMIPAVWPAAKQTSVPVPQLVYGFQLEKVTAREEVLTADPKEQEVRGILKARADAASAALKEPDKAFAEGRAKLESELAALRAANAPEDQLKKAQEALDKFPKTVEDAKKAWDKEKGLAARAAPPRPHAEPFPGKDEKAQDVARKNFLALIWHAFKRQYDALPCAQSARPFRSLVRSAYRLPAGRRRHATTQPDRLHAQPPAHGGREFSHQGSAGRLAAGRALFRRQAE